MDVMAERTRKRTLALLLKEMKAGEAYKAVLARIEQRCGKWFHAWVKADKEKAEALREVAKGYFTFDALVDEMIHEGECADQILKGKEAEVVSSPRNTGQGDSND